MITWLQTFFLKHNKWLFGVLLIVIIVTFVLTIGPQGIFDGGRTFRVEERDFYGYNLHSEEDQRRMFLNAEISAQLNPESPFRGEMVQQYAFIRVRALALADDLGIPTPDRDELEKYVRGLAAFKDPETGEFDTETYTQTTDFLRMRAGISSSHLNRVLREDFRIRKVVDALAGPGFLVPHEGKRALIDERSEFTAQTARYPFSGFRPEIESDEDDLRAFYDNNPARYALPERIRVRSVRFHADNFIDAVTRQPSDNDLRTHFERNQWRYQDLAPQPEEEGDAPGEVRFEDARERVERDWKREQARRIAEERSEDFVTSIHRAGLTRDSDDKVDGLIREFGGDVADVEPYSRNSPPQDGSIPRQLFNSMWIYQEGTRFYSDPAQTRDGAAVLLFDETVPARQPGFEEVRDRVAEDYRRQERRRLFSENLSQLRRELVERVEAGESFAKVAEEKGFRVNDPESFDGGNIPFSLQRNRLWENAQFLHSGQISDVILPEEDGFLVHMAERTTPEIDWEDAETTAFLREQRTEAKEFLGWILLQELTDKSLQAVGPLEG
ncbi:MAG: SurA N-terminal domain-containing protein [Opitutales bacterium]|nr:SurA N-terminal domain-containing protein [Opitutales bacterium]